MQEIESGYRYVLEAAEEGVPQIVSFVNVRPSAGGNYRELIHDGTTVEEVLKMLSSVLDNIQKVYPDKGCDTVAKDVSSALLKLENIKNVKTIKV